MKLASRYIFMKELLLLTNIIQKLKFLNKGNTQRGFDL
jgi:hypothetical protein